VNVFEHEGLKGGTPKKREITTTRVCVFQAEQFISRVLTRPDGFNEN
jgi:hypothetical protein